MKRTRRRTMTTLTWYQRARDEHAHRARWWLLRALDDQARAWEAHEAAHHAQLAAHYDHLARWQSRRRISKGA
jgi:hypothetical protein